MQDKIQEIRITKLIPWQIPRFLPRVKILSFEQICQISNYDTVLITHNKLLLKSYSQFHGDADIYHFNLKNVY